MFESIQPWIGMATIILVIALLVYCVILHIRLGRLKKKYDFFKYKDKDSIQPGTAPVSMIQDLEED